MSPAACPRRPPVDLNRLCYLGGAIHTWESTGLDVVNGTLATTRRCLRCPQGQHKPYGSAARRAWQDQQHP